LIIKVFCVKGVHIAERSIPPFRIYLGVPLGVTLQNTKADTPKCLYPNSESVRLNRGKSRINSQMVEGFSCLSKQTAQSSGSRNIAI